MKFHNRSMLNDTFYDNYYVDRWMNILLANVNLTFVEMYLKKTIRTGSEKMQFAN